ncbi:glycosyltransferase family 4 protein [Xanthobacter agilis]|uniref:Glycosyltransferase involved in cell wall biosynthesis n=1 Tax=Xanthobacter agilis TaxID=47492 RepID=A0ABU0LCJ7_XANAG|nr:glycosyltransferase family 1 protein [Xanthobacter agilis]MDQ0504874.1 glycosyltransferase involved in cell wall biosynthesis [Xanthobacter agilis]
MPAASRSAPARRTIMIDGYNLALERGTGVATYARNLSYACGSLGYRTDLLYGIPSSTAKDPFFREVSFFATQPERAKWSTRFARDLHSLTTPFLNPRALSIPVSGRVIIDQFANQMPHFDHIWNVANLFDRAFTLYYAYRLFSTVTGMDRPDLMHWTYPLPIRLKNTKNIYTIHDLVPLRLPYTTLDNRKYYFSLINNLLKRADHIVTVSESSKRDIVDIFGYPEEKITNTYQAVSIPQPLRDKSDDVVRQEVEGVFNLPYKSYFLFFGAIEPKKNVGRIIEGYLSSQVKEPLVLVGKPAWKADRELRVLSETSHGDRVRRFEYVSFPFLVSLIRGAKAVVFPSLYEGFGLPILEAMLLGTPVLTSDRSSIPEITGDAAIHVDPYDTRAIADALQTLSADNALCADLSTKGRRQAELFSPERYRERVAALYDRLLGPAP